MSKEHLLHTGMTPCEAIKEALNTRKWAVWRQGEGGNDSLVKDCLTRGEAESLVLEYESKGHKQTYLITRSHLPG